MSHFYFFKIYFFFIKFFNLTIYSNFNHFELSFFIFLLPYLFHNHCWIPHYNHICWELSAYYCSCSHYGVISYLCSWKDKDLTSYPYIFSYMNLSWSSTITSSLTRFNSMGTILLLATFFTFLLSLSHP